MNRLKIVCALGALILAQVSLHAATPRNVLFFGNSFILYYDARMAFSRIAQADGYPAPIIGGDVVQNTSLGDHINAVNSNSAILNDPALPPGGKWDNAIFQELSLLPTNAPNGNPTQFRSNAVTLYNQVKAHSPNVTPVLMETWAKQPLSTGYYPTPFATPSAMQSEIRANTLLAQQDINTAAGNTSLTRMARNGDAFEMQGFARNLYDQYEPSSDIKHPSPLGTLLNGLILYSAVYNEHVNDIPWSSVSSWASDYWDPPHNHFGYSINQTDWNQLTALAESVSLVPEPNSALAMLLATPMLLKRKRGR